MTQTKMEQYSSCCLCPRMCRVDRSSNLGYCRVSSTLKASRASLHMWEEPCISGKNGSGTVFFSGCNMGCVFCQNKMISREEIGKELSCERLSEIFFELEEKGAGNINLVTGDMFIPSIKNAIDIARKNGIRIPFLLNTSSYITEDTVKSLEGYIDIYLPDFKYIRDEDAVRYSNAPGYADAAKKAIREMVRQQPLCEFDSKTGLMKKGVVIRHLLMPGMLIQAKMIIKYLYGEYGDNVYLSLLSQFTPYGELADYPEINRKVTGYEYHSLVEYAENLGIKNCFIQVGDTAKESFIPDFDCRGI